MCGAWREMCGLRHICWVNRKQMGAIIEKGIRGLLSFFLSWKSYRYGSFPNQGLCFTFIASDFNSISCEGEIVPLADSLMFNVSHVFTKLTTESCFDLKVNCALYITNIIDKRQWTFFSFEISAMTNFSLERLNDMWSNQSLDIGKNRALQ